MQDEPAEGRGQTRALPVPFPFPHERLAVVTLHAIAKPARCAPRRGGIARGNVAVAVVVGAPRAPELGPPARLGGVRGGNHRAAVEGRPRDDPARHGHDPSGSFQRVQQARPVSTSQGSVVRQALVAFLVEPEVLQPLAA